jgi:hypothetical protein
MNSYAWLCELGNVLAYISHPFCRVACVKAASATSHTTKTNTTTVPYHHHSNQVTLPLEVGSRVSCKRRDESWHTARVIERRPAQGAANTQTAYDYYVHYYGRECV